MTRKIIFEILKEWLLKGTFVQNQILAESKKYHLTPQDQHFIQEIVYGVVRLYETLNFLVTIWTRQLSSKPRRLKPVENLVLVISLYQYLYLDNVPLYALKSEMMKIVKKKYPYFADYVYFLLNKLPSVHFYLPSDLTPNSLSLAHGYSRWYITQLIQDYGIEQTKKLLILGNERGVVMARCRNPKKESVFKSCVNNVAVPMNYIDNHEDVIKCAQSSDWYIQNKTPVELIHRLIGGRSYLGSVLDYCASPGGKGILVHDLVPNTRVVFNDISEMKIKQIRENLDKFSLCFDVTLNISHEKERSLFDVVICDVPCSNTGVLHKKVEARFRLGEQELNLLEEQQMKIVEKALTFLKDGGELWYLTCSILKLENEYLIEKICSRFDLKLQKEYFKILPDDLGGDGGFGCILKRE